MAKKTSPSPESAPVRAKAPAKPKSAAPKHRRTKASVPETGPSAAEPAVPVFTITHDDIATLAFSYWESRGCQGGSQQEDWDRAERELRSLIG